MVESVDWLCQRHFGKRLIDKDVEILDPAAGTGTFITELIEHFRGQPTKLRYKYLEEMHANEVAILPYYVANLNIEATYAAITGEYEEFPALCFVDMLDNVAPLHGIKGTQPDLFGALSEENIERSARTGADQCRHWQSAVQRQPTQREREQQEPRICRHRPTYQGDLRQS